MVCLACHPPERKVQQPLFVFLPVYPELVALVGDHVPDYRGIFLRGHGSQTSTHYGTVTHSSAGLGQLQGDAIRNIWGIIDQTGIIAFQDHYGGALTGDPSRDGYMPPGGDQLEKEGWTFIGSPSGIIFDASRSTPVAEEIRPVNKSVRYLIHAK